MCINPLQDKIDDIRAAEKSVCDELAESIDAGADSRKAFRKFRSELLQLYGMYKGLTAKAATDNERAMLASLLADIENDSRVAHEKQGYTYATLEELSELQ